MTSNVINTLPDKERRVYQRRAGAGSPASETELQRARRPSMAPPRMDGEVLEACFNWAGDVWLIVDGDGVIEAANHAAAQMFGYSSAELRGRNVALLLPASMTQRHVIRLRKYERSRAMQTQPQSQELIALHHDGITFPVKISILPVQSDHHQRFICTVRDAGKKIGPIATQRPGLAPNIPGNANEAIVLQDDTGQIVFASKQAGQLLDLPTEVLEQMNVRQMAFKGHTWLNPAQLASLSSDHPICIDTVVRRETGQEFLAEVQLERLKIAGRNYCLHTVRDISQQRQISDALRRLNGKLEQQVATRTARLRQAKVVAESNNKAKTDFLTKMSHEIRTPMGATISLTDLALANTTDPRQRDYLSKIRAASTHLLSIVDAILDLSKIEANKLCLRPADFDFLRFFDDLKCLNETAANKGLVLSFVLDPQLHRAVRTDAGRLKQVLLNYISNAVKFTHAGSIEVRATLQTALDGGPHILFEVIDTGIGLTPNQISRLFHPFCQVSSQDVNQYGSSGLGLSISKQLVELMGGKVGVKSKAGAGSTFWFHIPVKWGKADPLSPPCAVNGEQAKEQLRRQVRERGVTRVLVVDDNQLNQQIVLEMLAQCDITTVLADDGWAALNILSDQPIDCILMDLQMPVMDGYAAVKAIRRTAAIAHLSVIALTANVLAGDAERCRKSGFNAILTKPFSPRALYQHISEGLSRRETGPREAVSNDQLSSWSEGNRETELRLRQLFLLVALDSLAQMRAACTARHVKGIARHTHKLLPSAHMVDAAEVARLCTHLDRQLIAPNWREIKRTIAALGVVLSELEMAQAITLPSKLS
jgi:two-component system sensor histidine kinase/response regulator